METLKFPKSLMGVLLLLIKFCNGDILSKGAILMIRDITKHAKVMLFAGKKQKRRFKPRPVQSPSVRSLLQPVMLPSYCNGEMKVSREPYSVGLAHCACNK